MQVLDDLLTEIDRMTVIDTHEHFAREEDLVAESADVLTRLYVAYVIGAAVSAGWNGDRGELTDTTVPLPQRWRKLGPWLSAIRETGVAYAAQVAARDLFGIDEITDETYEILSQRIQESNQRGFFNKILRERCRMEKVLSEKRRHLVSPHHIEMRIGELMPQDGCVPYPRLVCMVNVETCFPVFHENRNEPSCSVDRRIFPI